MKRITTALLSLVLGSTIATAQQPKADTSKANRRPKIGLVLSGGGAKGLAHIGVLKAIDEAGLTIDYITGTSMGAILAGMYASGYSGKDIERIAGEMDWNSAMSSSVGYRNISIETKDQYERYLVEMPVKGLSVKPSTGIVEPQELMLKFSEVFYPVYQTKDFGQLPIPFKCIATDIGSGEVVVLDKGNIAEAVRSSMAIPGVFTATEYNGTKLVDGGIVRNFPVQNVIEMGADYVIGVNLFSGLTQSTDINNMIDVMMQVMNFSDAKDLVYEKSLCDMVIEPDVSRFSSASFSANKEIMAIGDSIGQDFYPLFKQLADSLHYAYDTPYANANGRMRSYPDSVRITGFTFYGLHETDESLLRHNLDLKAGRWYTPLDINKAMRRAYSSQYYKNLSYDLLPDTTGGFDHDVTMRCKVSELSLSMLKVGLNYNTFSNAALILGYNRKHLFGHRSVLDAKVAISESFQFMLRNRLFWGKNYNNNFDQQYRFSRYEIPIFGHKTTKKDFIYSYLHNNFSLTLGHVHNTSHSTDVSVGYETYSITPEFRGATQLDGTISDFYVRITDQYNSIDRKYLPTRGANIGVSLYWAAAPKYDVRPNYTEGGWPMVDLESKHVFRFTMEGNFYQTPVEKLTLIENFGLATTYNAQTFVHQTALGGPMPFMPSHFAFYGMKTASRFVPGVAMAKAGLQYKLMGELYVSMFANGALTFNGLETYVKDMMTLEVEETLVGAGIKVAYNLTRMPFEITLMSARNYGVNMSVNVGFPF